eukprot:jgi/Astpho2/9088/Aster-02744
MAATAIAQSASPVCSVRRSVETRRATSLPVAHAQRRTVCRASRSKVVSQQRDQQQQQLALPAGLVAGAGAMLAHPLVAEAGVTPSLKNLLFSVVAGGFVLSAIAIAVTGGLTHTV